MKNIFTIILMTVITNLNAQVIIGDGIGGPATDKSSVLLEFAVGQNKGLIVPYVRTLPIGTALAEGAIILDATTTTAARMKFYNGTSWVDLSGQDADVTSALTNQPTVPALETGARSIIGARTSPADGALVLESTTQAMILPIVADVQLIPSPSPGMMVYVDKPGAKRLAVFNGAKWSFWKP